MSYSFLIVEDEIMTSQFIKGVLENNEYKVVDTVESSSEARIVLKNKKVDFILLDINISGTEDGLQFAKKLVRSKINIIFITGYSQKDILQEAMLVNPCGFLIKPFGEQELIATILVAISMVKKQSLNSYNSLDYDNKNIANGFVLRNGKKIELSRQEARCLGYCIANANKIITHDDLSQHIWEVDNVSGVKIRELICRIRNKIPDINIISIYGKGYKLEKDINIRQ